MSECSSNRRNQGRTMNVTLTDDKSSSDNQSEKSTHEENKKYIVFTTRIRIGSYQGSEKAEGLDSDDKSDSISEEDIHEAYDKMYEGVLRL